jgi:hypothetical protein
MEQELLELAKQLCELSKKYGDRCISIFRTGEYDFATVLYRTDSGEIKSLTYQG